MADPFGGPALALVVLAFIAGATVPSYYFIEQMQGFGRAVAHRIPYRSPPGMSEEEALQQAREAAEGAPDDTEDTDDEPV